MVSIMLDLVHWGSCSTLAPPCGCLRFPRCLGVWEGGRWWWKRSLGPRRHMQGPEGQAGGETHPKQHWLVGTNKSVNICKAVV